MPKFLERVTVVIEEDGGKAKLAFSEAVAINDEAKIARSRGRERRVVKVRVRDEARGRHAMRLSAGALENRQRVDFVRVGPAERISGAKERPPCPPPIVS